MSRGDHLAAAGRLVKVPAFVLMCFADGIEVGLFKCLCPDYSTEQRPAVRLSIGERAPGFGWLFIPEAREQTQRVIAGGPLRRA